MDAAQAEARTLATLAPETAASAPVTALHRARVHLGRTHKALADIARRLGLDETAVGPLDKPEDTPPIGGGPRRRRPAPDPAS